MAEIPAASNPKWMTWTGWACTILAVAGLVFSAVIKFIGPADMVKEFGRLGWPSELAFALGVVELTCAILYLIPQTSVLGAILLTGYLGGATATHVRISDNFIPPIVVGVLVWLGLFLRDLRLRILIPLRR